MSPILNYALIGSRTAFLHVVSLNLGHIAEKLYALQLDPMKNAELTDKWRQMGGCDLELNEAIQAGMAKTGKNFDF